MDSDRRPTFAEVYRRLQAKGSASVRSSIDTPYTITAHSERTGRLVIIARPRRGQVRVHEDCWGDAATCQRTRAGGIYNGSPSIYDWYREAS